MVRAPWVAGTRGFVEAHAQELLLFVAFGTPDTELRPFVKRRGMTHYFRSVHGALATKGEIVGRLPARYSFAPQRMLIVGDAFSDLEEASGNGVPFVGRVLAGSASPFPSGTLVIADLHALPALVGA